MLSPPAQHLGCAECFHSDTTAESPSPAMGNETPSRELSEIARISVAARALQSYYN
jgi:hypothetical protein